MSLSVELRESLAAIVYDGGPSREDYLAGLEHWVNGLVADAWDEGARKASPHGGAYVRSFYAENPYREPAPAITTRLAIEWIESTRGNYWITAWRENDRQWEIVKHSDAATLSVRWHPGSPFMRVGERSGVEGARHLAAYIEGSA